jgi:hypothetical protein
MAVHPQSFRRRHTRVAEVFRDETGIAGPADATAPQARGCLLLFGGAHFEGAQALGRYIRNLSWVMAG